MPENCHVTRALAKDLGKFNVLSHFNSVSWDIDAKKGGTYTVTMDYAIAAPTSTLTMKGITSGAETKSILLTPEA